MIHSSIDGRWACFCVLAIVNNAAKNIASLRFTQVAASTLYSPTSFVQLFHAGPTVPPFHSCSVCHVDASPSLVSGHLSCLQSHAASSLLGYMSFLPVQNRWDNFLGWDCQEDSSYCVPLTLLEHFTMAWITLPNESKEGRGVAGWLGSLALELDCLTLNPAFTTY